MNDLISKQAAIDFINAGHLVNPNEPRWSDNEVVNFLKSRPSADVPHWIPCSEKLPDEDHWTGANFQYSADVLMTVYNAEDEETIIDYGHTVDGSWYSETTDCFVPSWWEVLAWMPLPEPYNGAE